MGADGVFPAARAFKEAADLEPKPKTADVLGHLASTLACTPRLEEARKAALKAALAADPDWEALDAGADPLLLQYNDPFQPPWKRRNEVVMAIRRVGVPSRPVQGNGGVAVEEDKEEAAAVVDYFAKLSELRDTSTKTLERRLG